MTMTAKNVLRTVLPALGLTLSLATPAMAGSSAAEVEQVLVKAEVSLGKTREAGNAWNNTEKLLKAARESLGAGATDDAMELANRALFTADMARQQNQLEQDAWQARMP